MPGVVKSITCSSGYVTAASGGLVEAADLSAAALASLGAAFKGVYRQRPTTETPSSSTNVQFTRTLANEGGYVPGDLAADTALRIPTGLGGYYLVGVEVQLASYEAGASVQVGYADAPVIIRCFPGNDSIIVARAVTLAELLPQDNVFVLQTGTVNVLYAALWAIRVWPSSNVRLATATLTLAGQPLDGMGTNPGGV